MTSELATPSYSLASTFMTSSMVYQDPKLRTTDLAFPIMDFHTAGSKTTEG